jgi:hypothetical protein
MIRKETNTLALILSTLSLLFGCTEAFSAELPLSNPYIPRPYAMLASALTEAGIKQYLRPWVAGSASTLLTPVKCRSWVQQRPQGE